MTIVVDFENSIAVLKNEVDQFIVGGPRASSVRGCWNIYFNLHDNFLNNAL